MGLSPRLRGSRDEYVSVSPGIRSIPALAGEPWMGGARRLRKRVYPRACGGAALGPAVEGRTAGLSPRFRGSPIDVDSTDGQPGSIPALAGEPLWIARKCCLAGVYPRACGGALAMYSCPAICAGLSPRLRGSQQLGRALADIGGSIPALAGEPQAARCLLMILRVYPRACGGAEEMTLGQLKYEGLSPRLRGSRAQGP